MSTNQAVSTFFCFASSNVDLSIALSLGVGTGGGGFGCLSLRSCLMVGGRCFIEIRGGIASAHAEGFVAGQSRILPGMDERNFPFGSRGSRTTSKVETKQPVI